MGILGRIGIVIGMALVIIGVILATMNWVTILFYLNALEAGRSKDFFNVNPRVAITNLVILAGGFFLGLGFATSMASRRLNKQDN